MRQRSGYVLSTSSTYTFPIGSDLHSPQFDTLRLTFAPLHNTILLLMGLLKVIQLSSRKVEFALPSVAVSPCDICN